MAWYFIIFFFTERYFTLNRMHLWEASWKQTKSRVIINSIDLFHFMTHTCWATLAQNLPKYLWDRDAVNNFLLKKIVQRKIQHGKRKGRRLTCETWFLWKKCWLLCFKYRGKNYKLLHWVHKNFKTSFLGLYLKCLGIQNQL